MNNRCRIEQWLKFDKVRYFIKGCCLGCADLIMGGIYIYAHTHYFNYFITSKIIIQSKYEIHHSLINLSNFNCKILLAVYGTLYSQEEQRASFYNLRLHVKRKRPVLHFHQVNKGEESYMQQKHVK